MMRSKEQAEQAVTEFHRQLDDGRHREIYEAAGSELKQATTEGEFTRLLATVRERLGAIRSTSQQGWHVNAGTGGTLVTLTYETQFASAPGTEQFVYRIDGERALLIGYHINSNALIATGPPAEENSAGE